MSQRHVPVHILQAAASLFAGGNGFSWRDLNEYFGDELGLPVRDILADGAANRSEGFKKCIKHLPIAKQKEVLSNLCKVELSAYHGWPNVAQRGELLGLLEAFQVPSGVSDEAVDTVLAVVNLPQVEEAWRKAQERRSSDPDGAITSARSLLESVVKHLLDEMGEPFEDKAELSELYRRTAKLMSLTPDQHSNDALKQILGGCVSIVHGLATVRNSLGDAHGKRRAAYKAAPRHAELAVTVAGGIAVFLMRTWEERKPEILTALAEKRAGVATVEIR